MSIAMKPAAQPVASGDSDSMKDQLHLSPDGTRVAYNAISAGREEVFVAAFPSFTGTVQVSDDGGVQPLWSRDGKELFYLAANKNLMSVQIRAGAGIEAFAPEGTLSNIAGGRVLGQRICGIAGRAESLRSRAGCGAGG